MVEREAPRKLAGRIVVDVDYLGGERSKHQRILTGGGPKSVALPAFRWVNSLPGNLKTALSGAYHAFKFDKYGHRYLAEFQYRFNRRNDLNAILPRLLRAAALTPMRNEA